jgi:hypothetical protein
MAVRRARLRARDVALHLAVALGLPERLRGALERVRGGLLIRLGARSRGGVEGVGGTRERLRRLWL